jgi:4-alpha-glucanotransferase
MKRSSGILLHITSLPSPHGIGDMGPAAFQWVDFLAAGKQSYWQILPLGPVGFGNSPYAALSAYAGNFMLVSLEKLVEDHLLLPEEIDPYGEYEARVRYEKVRRYKTQHLQKAFTRFEGNGVEMRTAYEEFRDTSPWLETYATLFSKREECDPEFIRFREFLFARQLSALKKYANEKKVGLIGDLPMYVAEDSADRLQSPELYDLTSGFVAGSPPDDMYPQGQKWGNPLYRWEKHRETGYRWWIDRVKFSLKQVDVLRLDYFCGYSEFWATNGSNGHWRRGPQHDLFHRTKEEINNLPFIAEDLGKLTPDIHNLRDSFGIYSTKVIQYAFDGSEDNPYLPNNFTSNRCAIYTSTHDSDTVRGWYDSAPDHVKENARRRMNCEGRDISWDVIKFCAQTNAELLIISYQDVLCLGREARFNTPGTVSQHNWSWRVTPQQINDDVAKSLAWLAGMSSRA